MPSTRSFALAALALAAPAQAASAPVDANDIVSVPTLGLGRSRRGFGSAGPLSFAYPLTSDLTL